MATTKGRGAFIAPKDVETFIRKIVKDDKALTSDGLGELLGVPHQAIVRLRKTGADKLTALAMAAVVAGLDPFNGASLKGEDLPTIPNTPNGHAFTKEPPKPRMTSAERRAALEANLRAQIEAEMKAKYGITDEVKEPEAA